MYKRFYLEELLNSHWEISISRRLIDNKVIIRYVDVYVKDMCALISAYGVGDTAELAAKDYYNQIIGKTLILHPFSKYRQEIAIY